MIRRAHIDDLEACVAVQKSADLAAFPHIFPPEQFPFPDDDVRARWHDNLTNADRYCILAEDEGGVVGTAVLIGDLFDSIAVVPERWGTDVAGRLYHEIIVVAKRRGLGSLQLWVLEKNLRARRFYQARGWRLDGRTKRLPFPPRPDLVGYTLDRV